MAQPIHCDGGGDQHPADVLISQLADGATSAWCFPHYGEVVRALVQALDEPTEDDQAAEAAALARLETVSAPSESEHSPAPAAAEPEPETDPPPSSDPAHVVPRGRSASRAAYEARRRAQETELDASATTGAVDGPGPSGEPVGDPDEVAAAP